MNTMNRILSVAAIATALLFVTQAKTQAANSDGIAASPKVRQMLNERNASFSVVATPATPTRGDSGYLAASPKLSQMLAERTGSSAVTSAALASASTSSLDDGIAASPKLREQLRERALAFQVAPIK